MDKFRVRRVQESFDSTNAVVLAADSELIPSSPVHILSKKHLRSPKKKRNYRDKGAFIEENRIEDRRPNV